MRTVFTDILVIEKSDLKNKRSTFRFDNVNRNILQSIYKAGVVLYKTAKRQRTIKDRYNLF